jgi:hypothetical protein
MQTQLSLPLGDIKETPKTPRSFERDCVICGNTFASKGPNAKYCSRECRSEAARERRQEAEATTNVIQFPKYEAPVEGNVDSSALAQLIKNQQLQIETQQHLIQLMQSTLETLRTNVGTGFDMRATQPMPPVPIEFDDDELPIVEVKKSTKSGQSSQNFLNSIMALNG